MSAEEAIARAKAIAARLAGTGATAATIPETAASVSSGLVADKQVDAVAEAALAAALGSGTVKRKRWATDSGSVEASNPVATSVNDALALAMSTKRQKPGGTEASKKVWIPVEKNPGYNYIGLLIGPGGSKQKELVEQSGGNVKISIRGRGSSSSNTVPGQPEEPLHVLLEGKQENVNIAEALVGELLNDSTKAQAEKERQLAVVSAAKGGGEKGMSNYQPKPVAQLIGLNGGGGHYGPASGDSSEMIEEKIGVPNGVVGYIIGKGGESITSMQRKSDCRVQIQKEHEMDPGTTQRIITLTAATQDSINSCRSIIEEMVRERLRLNEDQQGGSRGMMAPGLSGPGANAAAQAAQLQHALSDGQKHVTVVVPNADVGLIIGKGGSTIRSIQERSGANIQIPSGPDVGNPLIRTVNITHPQNEGAEFAKTLIEEILSTKTNQQQNNSYSSGASVQIQIPDKDVGMCIGKSGCVIREMQQRTQTRIQIPSQPTPGQQNRIATVSGPAEGCQKVQEIINRIIVEQSSQFVMAGAAFQQHTNAHYGQSQYGAVANQQAQPDYSAQWAAYYASVGQNVQGAGVAQTSAPVSAATISAAPGGNQGQQPAADAYYDDFFRYSYHYGESAARQYYAAWSPPVGTVNPYGTNPALDTTATNIDQKQENKESNQTITADTSQIRDSSVRNVSNLPAWMTK